MPDLSRSDLPGPAIPGTAPIAVALDGPDQATIVRWAELTAPSVAVMKVGLETYLRDGPAAVRAVREVSQRPIFLDLKLHDIPNTVAGAARSVAGLEPDFLTVHASGGAAMIAAAVKALPETRITAVTVLTSLSEADLQAVGLLGPALETASRLALLAVAAGARALVCSPHEVSRIRQEVGENVTLITPGVRPALPSGMEVRDQSRVSTPEAALADGADLLVIGRPITSAPDPGAAAAALAASLHTFGGTA